MVIKRRKLDWWLVGILVLAGFLYGWKIWEAGSANAYYTAAITSMVQSWSNFWYGAFDPAGFITVDKPPVALWFMAISAKIFGVHGWSVVLPSVLFGIGSVGLMYALIKPRFGAWAARLSALILTLTPIVVADSRTNNMDATLLFFLLLATWALMKAVSARKPWLVIVSFALIGISFNIKMLQAFMILPALLLFYWLASNQKWHKKMITLGVAAVALVGFTVAWPMAVDSTSAANRPYVGSSQTNSEMELAFGYNGTERLLGQTTGTGAAFSGMTSKSGSSEATKSPTTGTAPTGAQGTGAPTGQKPTGTPPSGAKGNGPGGTPPTGAGQKAGTTGKQPMTSGTRPAKPTGAEGMPGGFTGKGRGSRAGSMGGANGAFSIGTVGPLRLLQSDLGPQISWMLPAALIGFISAYAAYDDRKRKWYQLNAEQKHLGYWLAWLVPVAGFFSVASFFHPYYTIMLAPPIAALAAIGFVTMTKQFKGKLAQWQTWLLPVTVAITTGLGAWYVSLVYQWQTWLVVAMGVAALAILFATRTKKTKLGATVALIAMLAAPTWWSLSPTLSGESSGIPYASPTLLAASGQGQGAMGSGSADKALLTYVTKHQGSAKYLFATSDASTAAPYIIESGKAVMAIGGFNGTDPTLTLKQFKALVAKGEVKYYYDTGRAGNSAIAKWVEKNGKKITLTQSSSSSKMMGMGGQGTLYQLK
ncbi:glycosyltransferase family 39 protein [Lacticaseibacillus brantae]|uniref:4-amino-4-deoxy-L-arabinose transferase n=1 Tax=Lacticaseibacillus brantae DSM 23927 TaxID=1423727 RepID=A0A0R2AYT4_9LACO|nr:glycosyltransferase family 39 protein [Lacticaseibacillus brantae]KRM71925.1 4-amino-4-deoxy-L-arabinose transferase [Lacticaseibacillus brantae DSM 23927]